jgi:hypothetical protein
MTATVTATAAATVHHELAATVRTLARSEPDSRLPDLKCGGSVVGATQILICAVLVFRSTISLAIRFSSNRCQVVRDRHVYPIQSPA